MYDKNEENKEGEDDERNICPICGLRQYNDVCVNCGIKIKEDEEKEKTMDDDDEYDRRERR